MLEGRPMPIANVLAVMLLMVASFGGVFSLPSVTTSIALTAHGGVVAGALSSVALPSFTPPPIGGGGARRPGGPPPPVPPPRGGGGGRRGGGVCAGRRSAARGHGPT